MGIVNNMTVWTVSAGDGSVRVPVTVRDAVFFLATIVVTMSLVRDLPGIINIVILRRFPIDRSARYALVALGRYLIVVTGIIVALGHQISPDEVDLEIVRQEMLAASAEAVSKRFGSPRWGARLPRGNGDVLKSFARPAKPRSAGRGSTATRSARSAPCNGGNRFRF